MDNYKHIVLQFDQAQQPRFVEKKSKGYVEFGELNNYPEYLLGLYNESPKHGAIIKGKCNYIYGKGFEVPGSANGKDTWNDVMKKCIKDDELYRGFYLQIIWNRLKQVSEVYHLEFHKVRVSKDLTKFFVKDNWSDFKEKPREYDAFNVNNPVGSQIYYYKEYNPSSDIYPLPSYFQGLNYIESDIEISRHILGNAKKQWVASKLVNLNNGDPIGEENKGEVEKGLLKKFTGDSGSRVVIMFNKSKDNAADILDLGTTMLTKEDFTNVNNLVQQEIFASHQITSPSLFGIKTEGQLGSRNEIRDAYEIFNNTYVQERQSEMEVIFTRFRNLKGEQGDFNIIPVEPLKFEFTETIIAANLTQNEIRELMGKEPLQAGQVTSDGQIVVVNPETEKVVKPSEVQPVPMNESLKNLSGRQYQNVMRIVRQFGNGKLTKQQASLMLKNGFGFNDSDVDTFLGVDNDPLTEDEISKFSMNHDELLLQEFGLVGEGRLNYEILETKSFKDYQEFADSPLTQLEADILSLITKDGLSTPEVIAKTLKRSKSDVEDVISKLLDKKIISEKKTIVGTDVRIERIPNKTVSELPGKDSKVTDILVRYSYEGPQDNRNRPFCAKLMELDRFYSRQDIEKISERVGYSVWDRRGGWFTQPDGEHRPYCRHRWMVNIVKRKA
jgi:DNA-binding Lrp family transcriptional regulator